MRCKTMYSVRCLINPLTLSLSLWFSPSYLVGLEMEWAFVTYTSCDDHEAYTAYCWSGAKATNKTQALYNSSKLSSTFFINQ